MDTSVLRWLTFPPSVHQPGCFTGCQEVRRAQLSLGARPQVSSGLPPLLNFSLASSSHFLGLFRFLLLGGPGLVPDFPSFLPLPVLSLHRALWLWFPVPLGTPSTLLLDSPGHPGVRGLCWLTRMGKLGASVPRAAVYQSSGLRKLEAPCWGVERAREPQEMEK